MIGTGASAFFLLAIAVINLVDSARRLEELSPRAPRRTGRRAGIECASRRPRPACPHIPAAVPHGVAELADVPGRFFVRAWLRHRDRNQPVHCRRKPSLRRHDTSAPIMIFPALFTAGMTLVDTTDSVLMVGAYGWAFLNPIRKIWYNLTITAISVVVALLIGGIEALGLIADKLGLEGGLWDVDRRSQRWPCQFWLSGRRRIYRELGCLVSDLSLAAPRSAGRRARRMSAAADHLCLHDLQTRRRSGQRAAPRCAARGRHRARR